MSGASASAAHMVPARAARRLFSDQTLIGHTSLRRPPATAKRAGQPGHLRSAERQLQQLKRDRPRGQTLSGGLRFQRTLSWQSLSQSRPLAIPSMRANIASRLQEAAPCVAEPTGRTTPETKLYLGFLGGNVRSCRSHQKDAAPRADINATCQFSVAIPRILSPRYPRETRSECPPTSGEGKDRDMAAQRIRCAWPSERGGCNSDPR
jgi:hypothetical protein